MTKQQKNVIRISIIVLIIIMIAVILHFFNRTRYNDDTTTGNTSSNLLNGGLFCEVDDTIYFANPYDQNALYSMNTDLGNVKKISSDYIRQYEVTSRL